MSHHITDYDQAWENRMRHRAKNVEKLLGEVGKNDPVCSHCGQIVAIFFHSEDCALLKINPNNLKNAIGDANIELKRGINRRRVFHSDQPYWNGLPGEKKETLTGKRKRYPHPATREIHWCEVCETSHLFIGNKCTVCEHSQECAYLPSGPNCQTCHPGE